MKNLFLVISLLLFTVAAYSDPITLPVSGQSSAGTQDAFYRVLFPVAATTTSATGAAASAWKPTIIDPKWAVGANWITPLKDGMADLPGGTYTFLVNFDLPTGISSITGSLFADDRVEVWLNGQKMVTLPNDPGSGYWPHALSHFTLTSGLLVGANQLQFRVINTNPNTPVGLAIQSLVANAAPVPEPTTLLLLGSGLAGLAALTRKRAHSKGKGN